MRRPATVADYAATAHVTMRRDAWDFIAGGAGKEISLHDNEAAFDQYWLRPRVLTGTASRIDTRVDLLGSVWSAPIAVAPTALSTLVHSGGESATAAAASRLGLPMVVSTFAAHTIEDVTAASTDPGLIWQQLYVFRDRAVTASLAARAEASGVQALVVTVDTPWLGRRPRNIRGEFRIPADVRAGNLEKSLGAPTDIASPEAHSRNAIDPGITWADISKIVSSTALPVLVKGVLAGDDAQNAVDAGVQGIIVSNHGARQLDRVVPTLEALPGVVAAAGDVPVLVDGGIRSGADIAIALGLGARGVLIGRPVLWGLAVGGENGVSAVLSLLIDELNEAMAQSGISHPTQITPSFLHSSTHRVDSTRLPEAIRGESAIPSRIG
ncbi:alpha-hydroxy acid oxidase [Actinoallomurus acanthiterrae]